jgi:hypothetical protein
MKEVIVYHELDLGTLRNPRATIHDAGAGSSAIDAEGERV